MNVRTKTLVSPKKKILTVSLVLVLLAVAAWGLFQLIKIGSQGEAPAYIVTSEPFVDEIEVSGNVKPSQVQVLQFAFDGPLVSLPVREGQWVKKGAQLAQLDSLRQRSDLLKNDYEAKKIRAEGDLSALQIQMTERGYLEALLAQRTLTANFDGQISLLEKKEGEFIEAGHSLGRLIDAKTLLADVEVDETDIPRLAIGQRVVFHFQALPNLLVEGRVKSFPAEARITQKGLAVLDTRLVIENPPAGILPSYSFRAEIKVKEGQQYITVVESAALQYENGRPYVLVGDLKKEKRYIETAPFTADRVRILSGLQTGDRVYGPVPASPLGF